MKFNFPLQVVSVVHLVSQLIFSGPAWTSTLAEEFFKMGMVWDRQESQWTGFYLLKKTKLLHHFLFATYKLVPSIMTDIPGRTSSRPLFTKTETHKDFQVKNN